MWIIPGLIKEENVKHITGILRDTAMEDDWMNIYYLFGSKLSSSIVLANQSTDNKKCLSS